MNSEEESIIKELYTLYNSKKPLTIFYFYIFLSFLLLCIPGVFFYLRQEKINNNINKKINYLVDKHKENENVQKYNKMMYNDFYIKEKKGFLYFFIFFFTFFFCLVIAIIIIFALRK